MKWLFGRKVWKLSLDGGFTCPNRDGTLGYGGCTFCAGGGRFVPDSSLPMDVQIENAKAILGDKAKNAGFLAYFQSGTNTYAPVSHLRETFFPVIRREDILGLSIGTRPDCLGNEVLELLGELAVIKPLWVELGLQTSKDATAEKINRGYGRAVFDGAMEKLRAVGVRRVVHIIAGLPGETREDVFETVRHVASFRPEGVKLHLLHVMRGTALEQSWHRGEFETLSLDEYTEIAAETVRLLPPETTVHRITGDGDKRGLLAPEWSGDKKRVLSTVNRALEGVVQGEKFAQRR
ncbi:MAG: TIGR01212 family radical SAM protein [Clostridia bacterium]|nr:TIGR01212 family radical SAM protein [Clostridia bacterium]